MSATETADENPELGVKFSYLIAELEAECREWKEQCEKGTRNWLGVRNGGSYAGRGPQESGGGQQHRCPDHRTRGGIVCVNPRQPARMLSDGAPTWPDTNHLAVRAVEGAAQGLRRCCASFTLNSRAPPPGEAPHKQCSGCEG